MNLYTVSLYDKNLDLFLMIIKSVFIQLKVGCNICQNKLHTGMYSILNHLKRHYLELKTVN